MDEPHAAPSMRDVHDVVIPRLSMLGFGLADLASRLDGEPRALALMLLDELDDIVRATRHAIADRSIERGAVASA